MLARWPQDGPRGPRGLKTGPGWAQEGTGSSKWRGDGPKKAQDEPEIGPRKAKRAQESPKWGQAWPKGAQEDPRWAPDGPQKSQEGPRGVQKGPKMGFNWGQDRQSEAFEDGYRKRPTPDQPFHQSLEDVGAFLGLSWGLLGPFRSYLGHL